MTGLLLYHSIDIRRPPVTLLLLGTTLPTTVHCNTITRSLLWPEKPDSRSDKTTNERTTEGLLDALPGHGRHGSGGLSFGFLELFAPSSPSLENLSLSANAAPHRAGAHAHTFTYCYNGGPHPHKLKRGTFRLLPLHVWCQHGQLKHGCANPPGSLTPVQGVAAPSLL